MDISEQLAKITESLEAQPARSTEMKPWDIADWDPERELPNRLLTMPRGRF